MSTIKTTANDGDVIGFLAGLPAEQRTDSEALIKIMADVSGEKPVLWGTSIIGFGTMQYVTANGQANDWMRIGFSPRKGKLSLYVTVVAERYKEQLDDMGKYKMGKGCIYLAKLADVDKTKLTALITDAYAKSGSQFMREKEQS